MMFSRDVFGRRPAGLGRIGQVGVPVGVPLYDVSPSKPLMPSGTMAPAVIQVKPKPTVVTAGPCTQLAVALKAQVAAKRITLAQATAQLQACAKGAQPSPSDPIVPTGDELKPQVITSDGGALDPIAISVANGQTSTPVMPETAPPDEMTGAPPSPGEGMLVQPAVPEQPILPPAVAEAAQKKVGVPLWALGLGALVIWKLWR